MHPLLLYLLRGKTKSGASPRQVSGTAPKHTSSHSDAHDIRDYDFSNATVDAHPGTIITRIDGKLYDLSDFALRHPGGAQALKAWHQRDASIAFELNHGIDPKVKQMLSKFEVEDEAHGADIMALPSCDAALLRLHRQCNEDPRTRLTTLEIVWLLAKPVLFMLAGCLLLFISKSSETLLGPSMTWYAYAAGFFLAAFAAADEVGLAHSLMHHQVFKSDGTWNRLMAGWHSVLTIGANVRMVYRDHAEHHTNPNVLTYDRATLIPGVVWHPDGPVYHPEMHWLPRWMSLGVGPIVLYPFTLIATLDLPLPDYSYKPRLDRCGATPAMKLATLLRLAVAVYWLGVFDALAPCVAGQYFVALTAAMLHFDQPMMLPSEIAAKTSSYVHHQLSTVWSFTGVSTANGAASVTVDHAYHHLLPNVHAWKLMNVQKEMDAVAAEAGYRVKQCGLWEKARCAFEFHVRPIGDVPCRVGYEPVNPSVRS